MPVPGARTAQAADPPQLSTAEREQIHERAGRRFASAALARPGTTETLPFDVYLAPMLLHEVSETQPPGADAFGALELHTDGRVEVHVDLPTLYFERSTAALGGHQLEQLAFLWWYPGEPGAAPAVQGVRTTLGSDGLPIVWEVLADPSGASVVFVSESLEAQARAHHGDPLEGRRFSVERAHDEAPALVVARVLSDGPTPMGPYVYVERTTRAVRTLLCRCTASEFDALAGEVLYELVDLAQPASLGLEPGGWGPTLPRPAGQQPQAPADADDPGWLERCLRLPPDL